MKTQFEKMRAGRVRCQEARLRETRKQLWASVDSVVRFVPVYSPTNEQQAQARAYQERALFGIVGERTEMSFWGRVGQLFWPTNRGKR